MSDQSVSDSVAWREVIVSPQAGALAVIAMAIWMHAANSLLVTTLLPAIVADIGGRALVAWSLALYEMGTIITGIAGGLMAIRFGLRAPMAATALLFFAGCITSASAQTMPGLLVGRFVQGLGGGGLVALCFVAVTVLFPRRLVARATAVISTVWGVSAFLGALIGGLLVEYATWRVGFAAFAVQALIVTAALIMSKQFGAAPTQTEEQRSFPAARLAFLALGVASIAYAGIEVALLRTSGFVVLGILCLALVLALDRRAGTNRLLPKAPFSLVTPQGAALTMMLFFGMATVAITAYGPILMTAIHGVSALTAGYIVAGHSIGWTAAAFFVSGAAERHDSKLIAFGLALATLSIFGFLWSVPNGPASLIAVFTIMEGCGFGLAFTFLLRRVISVIDPAEIERTASAIPTTQRFGYALGVAYIGIIANMAGYPVAETPEETAAAARIIFASCLPLAGIGIVATVMLLTRKRAVASD
ncbi:MFS transporter [Tateyamaria omphalii]|uniref:MFS transporter n=1 Tax=Tateyamaria omphalii TaxID=299262 RepID=UPI001672E6EC|nr:MFS transporter [Tateyamaria omphalii]GGX38097.1 MFS transporter [Tateyamaria omphalii]